MKGEDMNFSEQGIQESLKKVLLPLWNAYTFFATYANIDGWEPDGTEIYLIRHGQTKNNAEHRLNGGSQDQPLNDVGRKQGEEVRIALEKI
jgi:isoleucyl-tRNA synthetase